MVRATKLAAVSALAILAAQTASARDLVIAGWGGNYQDHQSTAIFKPFAQEKGINLTETTYLGGLAELKTMAETGDVIWDLVIMEGNDLQVACDEGLVEEFDWDDIVDKDDLIPDAVRPCGVGSVVVGTGFAYNKETLKEAPTSLEDFFDTERFPGKRGMRTGPSFNLELVLMADGVPPEDVYDVLGTPEGLDRAFAKLDTIKSDLQFWDAGAQPVEWLVANNVVLTISYNARITAAKREGQQLEFVWERPIYSIDSWAVPADAPNKELAMEFLNYVTNAQRQADFSTLMPYGPSNVNAPGLMAAEDAAELPAGENIAGGLFFSDPFWTDHKDAITERWNNWVTQ